MYCNLKNNGEELPMHPWCNINIGCVSVTIHKTHDTISPAQVFVSFSGDFTSPASFFTCFIWSNKRPRLRLPLLYLPYERGGLKLPNRADVTEPDPNPSIISKYLSEPDPARRVPSRRVPSGPVGSRRVRRVPSDAPSRIVQAALAQLSWICLS